MHKNKAAASCRTPNASRHQRPLHTRHRVKYHWDQRRSRMGPYGDRHVVFYVMPIWFRASWLRIRTKRQQAAALQTLRAYQRLLHTRHRVKYHWDQRRSRMGPYGDRHVVFYVMPIWFQASWLCIRTKRQQAAALQALRAYQRLLHTRRRVRSHWDHRRDRMGPYGDRHGVGAELRRSSFGTGAKRWGNAIRTGKLSVFRVNGVL